MIFKRTVLSGLVAELPPEVWTSDEVERRLAPLYGRLKLPEGRLELMTGIRERRFWPQPIRPSAASALAGRRAMQAAGVGPADIDLLIHSSVCRDRLEPSTAAYVHGLLGLGPQAQILDVSLNDGSQFGVDWTLLRERVAARVARGKVDLTLRLRSAEGGNALQLNVNLYHTKVRDYQNVTSFADAASPTGFRPSSGGTSTSSPPRPVTVAATITNSPCQWTSRATARLGSRRPRTPKTS